MTAIQAPRGTRDLLPPAFAQQRWVLDSHTRVAEQHGYQAIETPIFEHTELFARAVGVESDIVSKEMFTFEDRGGRSLVLRPEDTAGVVRAALSAHLEQDLRPVRLHCAGPMFRAERPQHGRQHQFTQISAECLGERSPHLDAEVIEMAVRFFAALGITGVRMQLNSLGSAEDRARYRQRLVEYYTPLREQLDDDCKRRLTTNPLRLLDCKRDAALAERAPLITDSLSAESAAFFDALRLLLRDAGIEYEHNPRLVRGLDYYTDTVFEFWHEQLSGTQNALGGGGRYDGLAEVLGFDATPGVGYSLGVERILIVADALGLAPGNAIGADALVMPVAEDQASSAAKCARELRTAGLRVILDAGPRKLDRKLRNADRAGARLVVILGEDEVARGEVTLRDLAGHTQQRIRVTELATTALRIVGAAS